MYRMDNVRIKSIKILNKDKVNKQSQKTIMEREFIQA